MLLALDEVFTNLVRTHIGKLGEVLSSLAEGCYNLKTVVSMRLWETPVPIPNTMVKTQEADGTMLETAWESRWLPDYKKRIQETFHKFRQNRIYRNVH